MGEWMKQQNLLVHPGMNKPRVHLLCPPEVMGLIYRGIYATMYECGMRYISPEDLYEPTFLTPACRPRSTWVANPLLYIIRKLRRLHSSITKAILSIVFARYRLYYVENHGFLMAFYPLNTQAPEKTKMERRNNWRIQIPQITSGSTYFTQHVALFLARICPRISTYLNRMT